MFIQYSTATSLNDQCKTLFGKFNISEYVVHIFWGGFSSFWNENTNSVNDKIRKDDNINSITSINVFHIEFDL